jgi:hypothetical protein
MFREYLLLFFLLFRCLLDVLEIGLLFSINLFYGISWLVPMNKIDLGYFFVVAKLFFNPFIIFVNFGYYHQFFIYKVFLKISGESVEKYWKMWKKTKPKKNRKLPFTYKILLCNWTQWKSLQFRFFFTFLFIFKAWEKHASRLSQILLAIHIEEGLLI